MGISVDLDAGLGQEPPYLLEPGLIFSQGALKGQGGISDLDLDLLNLPLVAG